MRIRAPKSLRPTDIHHFLAATEYFFEKKRHESNFVLDLTWVKKTHFLGVLLIYKLMEFSYSKLRFIQPLIETDEYGNIENDFVKFGFWDLINDYTRQRDTDYRKLRVVVQDNFFLAPQALLRGDSYSKLSLIDKVLPQIKSYYTNDSAVNMIFQCLSEIILNFWEHAVDDTKSIILARGTQEVIEIACADTAKGIISTLGPTLQAGLTGEQILKKSVEKDVTSKKKTNHMGHGLWQLSELVSLNGGRMHLYSEGFMYRNEAGNVAIHKCGYWGGTIIYMSLFVRKPVNVSDIPEYKNDLSLNEIKIDFK